MSIDGIMSLEAIADASPETWEKAKAVVVSYLDQKDPGTASMVLSMLGMDSL